MTITLPEELRADAERQAREAGFATVSEYVADLIARDHVEVSEAGSRPSAVTFQTREELERLLDAGATGGWKTADGSFWAERQRVLFDRLATRPAADS